MNEWWKKNLDQVRFNLDGEDFTKKDCSSFCTISGRARIKSSGKHINFDTNHHMPVAEQKRSFDQMERLGIRVLPSRLTTLTVTKHGESPFKVETLVQDDVSLYCENHGILIYDHMQPSQQFIGKQFDFIALRERFKDKLFCQTMLRKLLIDHTISKAYEFPLTSEFDLMCLEMNADPTQAPMAQMFVQVPHHVSAKCSGLPNLTEFKSNTNFPFLVNSLVARFMTISVGRNDLPEKAFMEIRREIEKNILTAIKEDAFLETIVWELNFKNLLNTYANIHRNIERKASKAPLKYTPLLTASTNLIKELNEEASQLFKNGNPSTKEIDNFISNCSAKIEVCETVFKPHRGFGKHNAFIRGILGFLATISVLPAAIVSKKSSAGYKATFFGAPMTDSHKGLAALKESLDETCNTLKSKIG